MWLTKEYRKRVKGCGLKMKVYVFVNMLIDAFERALDGFDTYDVMDPSGSFIDRYKRIIEEKLESNITLTIPRDQTVSYGNRLYHTEDETKKILCTMLYHLSMMEEDFVEKCLYDKNVYDDDYDYNNYTVERANRIFEVMNKHKDLFMELFNTYFWYL